MQCPLLSFPWEGWEAREACRRHKTVDRWAPLELARCPAEIYEPSARPYRGLPDIDYPLHDKTIVVTRCGRIRLGKKKINFSQVFGGQAVGIKEVHDDISLVSFMDYDLGYFDLETRVLEPLENPFGPKVLPMS
jgi:putative transposase